ncbi:metal ABC transporter solute-binding protein, Zn/Mn family [Leptothermofonsia sp. ETS-13]|uniref:metal ABC transporter solute-binding protein, Zn/Mn family n=1 Tax=Leptothermofonsia sp. ETS-13 TaxID=3035696 RepID=UPI003BA3839A
MINRKGVKRRQFLVGLVSVLILHGCSRTQPVSPQVSIDVRPKVVSTSTILTNLTSEIAGDAIQLTGILKPGADPHVYEPIPTDSKALEEADLILYNGYDLEPGIIRLMNAAGAETRKLAVGEVVSPIEMQKQGQKVPDPHVWGDVRNVITMVLVIRDALIELSPININRDRFTQNATRFRQHLEQLDIWIREQIKTIPPPNRKLVTTHDAFHYYARAYGLTLAGSLIGISTEEQPSAQTVQQLTDSIRVAGVPAIFAETTINPALIKTVAQEAGVKLAPRQLYSDSLGAPGSGADTYVKMMVVNTTTIAQALGGKVKPFKPKITSE